MRSILKLFQERRWLLPVAVLAVGGLSWLMLYRLGSLTGGLSSSEHQVATTVYGWHGLWRQPLYLPLNALRSIVFVAFQHHGYTLTRLPNVLFGASTIMTCAMLLYSWYSGRTAVLTAILFATSAWTLHVSRLASNDVLYLWALPTLLLTHLALQRRKFKLISMYSCLVLWLVLLYIPGLVWLVLLNIFWSRQAWWQIWRQRLVWWQQALYAFIALLSLVFLAIGLSRPGNLRLWAGLPAHFATPLTLLKQFAAVPLHLSVRGPENSALWLGKAPLLDIFSLVATIIGLFFYARHWRASRSQLLFSFLAVGWLLVALGGPVSLSLLVPLLYLCLAGGIAYLLREWLRVFPLNPLARGVGIGLITLVVCLSAGYNLRAYFVAWPHDPSTRVTFDRRD